MQSTELQCYGNDVKQIYIYIYIVVRKPYGKCKRYEEYIFCKPAAVSEKKKISRVR